MENILGTSKYFRILSGKKSNETEVIDFVQLQILPNFHRSPCFIRDDLGNRTWSDSHVKASDDNCKLANSFFFSSYMLQTWSF